MFHEGELAMQRQAGVERVAAQVGRNLHSWIPGDYAEFLSEQPFVVTAGQGDGGRVWASLLVGGVGFAQVLGERQLLLAAAPAADDPLEPPHGRIGILAIDFDARARIRVNGPAERTPDGIVVAVEEAFGNCPKYIQRRLPVARIEPGPSAERRDGAALTAGQADLIRAADTFFVASAHRQRGADASHRGGRPGFVEVAGDGRTLRFPDYSGNRMFQTLGNLAVDPRAGLLFLDWETGATLQLTGRARVVWDPSEVAAWPGAERLVDVEIDAVRERAAAMPARWSLVEPSRLNPPVA
jgi:predicted pyridoxine 5'-phosphate oxidase superfamily flavin-nucleotide-binding protein